MFTRGGSGAARLYTPKGRAFVRRERATPFFPHRLVTVTEPNASGYSFQRASTGRADTVAVAPVNTGDERRLFLPGGPRIIIFDGARRRANKRQGKFREKRASPLRSRRERTVNGLR